MGNCQAVDAAALVIQHPSGKQERMYWPVAASQENSDDNKTVRFTRVKLLRPSDTLVLGRAYRLVTTQEVMKVLRAKKHAKMKKRQPESGETLQMNSEKKSTSSECEPGKSASQKNNQATRPDRHQQRSGSTKFAAGRPKSWRPSLHSISESGS
ncbi:UNVERIFIED_CONTAM: hypothetical protein Slati_1838500 [Sesamum latifolium]|uniref:Uncharacterized protein n=1 Tax=Sesamum latifolium TaxID=2727402 RepID=A0AAW2X1X4_9LAMI